MSLIAETIMGIWVGEGLNPCSWDIGGPLTESVYLFTRKGQ